MDLKDLGRPTKFTPADLDLIVRLGGGGCDVSTFCKLRNISRSTFYEWKKQFPEFKEAAEAAKESHLSYFTTLLKEIGEGERKGNVAAIKELLDRTHGSVQAAERAKTEINIGNMNVLQGISEDDLKARIASKMKALNIVQDVVNDAGDEPPEAA